MAVRSLVVCRMPTRVGLSGSSHRMHFGCELAEYPLSFSWWCREKSR
jgi:hypothetical protein